MLICPAIFMFCFKVANITDIYIFVWGWRVEIRRQHQRGIGHLHNVLTVIGAPQLCSVHNTDVGESSVSHASPMELKF